MAHIEVLDTARLKRLRLRIDTDDPQYKGKKKLKVRGKDLNNLPLEIFGITELEVLDLSPEREACIDYKVVGIPPQIGKLVNLEVLMLDTNELPVLPQEVGMLSSLVRLSLSNNILEDLPVGLGNLKNLKSLHLANNELKIFPMCICELENLTFLDLSDNYMKDIPSKISNLKKMQSLLLYLNHIHEIPDSICELTQLRSLWLGGNHLKRLPSKFGNLKYLDWGYNHTESVVIDGNPITHPPPEVCKQGVYAIARYFQTSERG